MKKLTDKELNNKLIEALNITEPEARKAFDELMNEKVKQIRKDIRKEVYEELAKQSTIDQKNLVESMNSVLNNTISDERKTLDVHRKNLIKEKLEYKNLKESLKAELVDGIAKNKEEFNQKLAEGIAQNKQTLEDEKLQYLAKAESYITEAISNEIKNSRENETQLKTALKQCNKFITEQVTSLIKEYRKNIADLDSLKVKLVKEQNEKILESQKTALDKITKEAYKFYTNAINEHLVKFRKEIAESRKNKFGAKIFEEYSKEFARQFFNEDAIVRATMKSIKANQNKLSTINQQLEESKTKLEKENTMLKNCNNSLTRDKIINENIAHLSLDKQQMMKKLLDKVETEKLEESIKRYIPMVLEQKSANLINKKRDRIICEDNQMRVLTGESSKNNKINADEYLVDNATLKNQIDEILKI